MARLGHRAAEDCRPARQSHSAWRQGIGRVPCSDSVDAGLRVFRETDHNRLELIGLHTNLPNAIPPEIDKAAAAGAPPPSGLSAEETHAYETIVVLYKTIPTQFFMGSRPQTLYGIADSPVGMA